MPEVRTRLASASGSAPSASTAAPTAGSSSRASPSLSGARPLPLGPDGASAPYFDLAVFDDGLAYAMLVNPVIQGQLINMPFGVLDGAGIGIAAIDVTGFTSLPAGLIHVYCCAMVLGPGNTVEVTTNPVCFDNLGTPCL